MKNIIQARIISLENNLGRRTHAANEIQKSFIDWKFIDAIDGRKLKNIPNYDSKKGVRLIGFKLTPGEIGCFLSHRLAWQQCVETQLITLVLEDDFSILPFFNSAIISALDISQSWEILRLQAIADVPCKKIANHQGFTFFYNLKDPLGSSAYIVKPSSAKTLLQMSESFIEPLDHFLENYPKHKLKITAIKPYPVNTLETESTIDSSGENRDSRKPIRGWAKFKRSVYRNIYRALTFKSAP